MDIAPRTTDNSSTSTPDALPAGHSVDCTGYDPALISAPPVNVTTTTSSWNFRGVPDFVPVNGC